MNTQNNTVVKLAETALLAALCYVSFTFLQIKIPVPGGDATSIHIGNAFWRAGGITSWRRIWRTCRCDRNGNRGCDWIRFILQVRRKLLS